MRATGMSCCASPSMWRNIERALAEPKDSTMHHYNRLRQALQRSGGATDGDARTTG